MRHLLLRGGCVWIGWGILRIVVTPAVVHRWIRARMVNWCWWLIKAIEVSFIIIVCVVVQSMRLVSVRVVIPLSWLRLLLMVIHWLHVMVLIVVPG